jgi:CheY-like chemotaxis protein
MDGEEIFWELRRLRGDLPVLLSSGYAEAEVTQRFAGLGLAGVVQKPYNLAELARRLRPLLPAQETTAPAA